MVGRVGDGMSEPELETLLEATLFGSGKSLSIKELSESLGYEEEEISEALASLQGTIKRRRGGALRIVEIGGKWAMEVRPNVADHLPKETKTEMPKKLLKAASGELDDASADRMIENVIGTMSLPVGVATNFIIDQKHYVVPFCLEESSVVAAASNMAKRCHAKGGFSSNNDAPMMIAQIQLLDVIMIEDLWPDLKTFEEVLAATLEADEEAQIARGDSKTGSELHAERLQERAEKARLAEEKARLKLEKEQQEAAPEFNEHEWLVE